MAIRRLNQFLDRLLYWATAISSMLFFILVMVTVLSRYVFHAPLLASMELSRLLFVWACFLAASIAYRRNAHVGFVLVVDRMSSSVRRPLSYVLQAMILLFMLLVFWHSVMVCRLLWPTDLPLLGISQSWFFVPLSAVSPVMASFTVENIMNLASAGAGHRLDPFFHRERE